MWAKVAEEMQVPWRAAEAMHWQLGEAEMARRAGVVPFTLNISSNESQGSQRISPSRGHAHSQSQGSLPRDLSGIPSPRYSRGTGPMPALMPPHTPTGRTLPSRRESLPPRPTFAPPEQPEYVYGPAPGQGPGPGPGIGVGVGLAPIQTTTTTTTTTTNLGRGGMLPGVAELTTGISPYSTPAYSVSGGGAGAGGYPSASPIHSATASPGPGTLLPALSPYPTLEPAGTVKRRPSPPDTAARETSLRRQLYPHPETGEYARPMGPIGSMGSMGSIGSMDPGGQAVPARRGPPHGP